MEERERVAKQSKRRYYAREKNKKTANLADDIPCLGSNLPYALFSCLNREIKIKIKRATLILHKGQKGIDEHIYILSMHADMKIYSCAQNKGTETKNEEWYQVVFQ